MIGTMAYDEDAGTLTIEYDVLASIQGHFDRLVEMRASGEGYLLPETEPETEPEAEDGEQTYAEFLEDSYFEHLSEINRLHEENDRLAAGLVDAQHELEAANEALSNALSQPREIVLNCRSLNMEIDRGYDEFGPSLVRRSPEVTITSEIFPRDMGPSLESLLDHLAGNFGRRSAG